MPSNYLYFVSTNLVSIPEELHCCDDESIISGPIEVPVRSSSSIDSTASPSLVPVMRIWFCDAAKSSSFMPKVPTRSKDQ
jgi:hypothetical protein